MMKMAARILISALFSFVMLVIPLASPISYVFAEGESDQYCDDTEISTANQYWDFSGHTLAQSFTPTQKNLDSIMVGIAMGADNPKLVIIEVRKITGGDALIAARSIAGSTALVSWVELDFTGTELDTNNQYQIIVSTESTTAHWVYSTASCYAGGTAIVDGAAQANQDFGFVTTGSGGASPATVETPATETPAAETPTTATTTIISEPTAVKAEYQAATKTIKISWTKSTTTDIDGYKIYRSEIQTKGYKKIAEAKKEIVEHSDTTFSAEKTYYYFIRAYKGTAESANSTIVSVTTPKAETVVEAVVEPEKTITAIDPGNDGNNNYQQPLIVWILGGAVGALVIALIVYEIIRARKNPKDTGDSFRLLK
jgi:hypothetical protein